MDGQTLCANGIDGFWGQAPRYGASRSQVVTHARCLMHPRLSSGSIVDLPCGVGKTVRPLLILWLLPAEMRKGRGETVFL
jgi:hypothetical protein